MRPFPWISSCGSVCCWVRGWTVALSSTGDTSAGHHPATHRESGSEATPLRPSCALAPELAEFRSCCL